MTDNNNNEIVIEQEEHKIIPQEIMNKWSLIPEMFIKPKGVVEIEDAIAYFELLIDQWLAQYSEDDYVDKDINLELNYVKAGKIIRNHKQSLSDMVAKVQKVEDEEVHGEELPEAIQDTLSRFATLIKDKNLHYVESDDVFYMQKGFTEGKWTVVTKPVLRTGYGIILSDAASPMVTELLDAAGRRKDNVVCTFKSCAGDELNVMQKGAWLIPEEGDYHPILDVLFSSINDGSKACIDMTERWLMYKYFKPEDHRLMALVRYGEGKVGKTEYANTMVYTLFGGVGVKVLSAEGVFGQFNGDMLGNVFTLVDEFNTSRAFIDNIQLMVGNSTLEINVKRGVKGTFANTSGFEFAANGNVAQALINGTGTDVRYGFIPVKRNVIIHAMIYLDMPSEHLEGKSPKECRDDENYLKAEKWYNNNLEYLSDNEHVARWFGAIVVKHADAWNEDGDFIMDKPMPIFDEEYKNHVQDNKPIIETFCDKLFNHPHFRAIKRKEMYKLFYAYVKDEGSDWNRNNGEGSNRFWRKVTQYIVKKKLPVKVAESSSRKKLRDEKDNYKNFAGVYNDKCEERMLYIDYQYSRKDRNGVQIFLGKWFDDDYNENIGSLAAARMLRASNANN